MKVEVQEDIEKKGKKFVIIKVRENEENDFYLFPRKDIEKTIAIVKASKIFCDAFSADSNICTMLPLCESKISVESYDESEVIALNCGIAIEEIYHLIDYIENHENEVIRIQIFKNSELPEFEELLSKNANEKLSMEQKTLLKEYMKVLLDISDSDRLEKILDYWKQASFGKLLLNYSKEVQDFIFHHVTKRMENELKEEMKNIR